ncbi:unnamed protein product [Closterium sp. NIES-54]
MSLCHRPRLYCVGRGRLAMRRRFGSGARSPLSAIPLRASSLLALSATSSLASPPTPRPGSFTTLPRAASCPHRTSPLTNPAPSVVFQVDPPPWLNLWRSPLTPLAQLRGVTPLLTARRPLAAPRAWRPLLGVDSGGAGPWVAESWGASYGGADSGGAGSVGADIGGAVSPSGGGVVGAPAGGSGVGQQQ